MRRTNWSAIVQSQKLLQSRVKNTKGVREYFQNKPEEGYMFDNIKKNIVKISECKDSTLRRYTKLLEKYYYLLDDQSEKREILYKKAEVEKELLSRPVENG